MRNLKINCDRTHSKPALKTLDDLLDDWTVSEIKAMEGLAEVLPTMMADWWAVLNDEGIIAYFEYEKDACAFRLNKINNILNA